MHHYLLSVMMSILFDLCPQVLQLVLYILLVSLVLYMHVTSLKISTTYTYFFKLYMQPKYSNYHLQSSPHAHPRSSGRLGSP